MMAFFDKDELLAKAKELKEKATDSLGQAVDSVKQYASDSKASKAAVEGAIARYGVTYKGGLKEYGKEKVGEIGFNIMPDSFILKPTSNSGDWFTEMEIPYDKIQSLEIVKRQSGAWEMVLSSPGSNVQDTETLNVIAITYTGDDGEEILLRLEMLTGVNVYTQAKKCQEMLDILRQNKILGRVNKKEKNNNGGAAHYSAADELKKYKELLESDIITQEEFERKKEQLLGL